MTATGEPLRRDRAFRIYWTGQTVSYVGSAVTLVVLPTLVLRQTDSAIATSLLSVMQVGPYLLFGLLAGVVADRVDRRKLMVTADMVNAALLVSIPLAEAADVLSTGQVYAVAFGTAVCFVFGDAAAFGALPAIVGRARLPAAFASLATASTSAGIAGPAVGGILIAAVGASAALAVDAASFVLSAMSLLLIARPFGGRPATSRSTTPAEDLLEGLRFVVREPLIRLLTALGFANAAAAGAVMGLLVVYADRALGVPPDDGRIGWLFTAAGVGALLASVAMPRLQRDVPVGWLTIAGFVLQAAAVVVLVTVERLAVAFVGLVVFQAATSIVIINGITVRQVLTPDELQGRVNTTGRMIAWGGTPFGAVAAGVFAEASNIQDAYAFAAALLGMGFLVSVGTRLRDRSLTMEAIGTVAEV